MDLKFSKVGILVALAVLIPATISLVLITNVGPATAFLCFISWILIPVFIARLYYYYIGKE